MQRKINTLLMIIALAASSLGYPGATQTWYQVLEVKSTASKQTDLFETKGTKWRIRWQKPTAEDHLTISVYDKNGAPIELISTNGATKDESYIHKPGTFYLKIIARCAYMRIPLKAATHSGVSGHP
jgi:hypothetical protein